METTTLLIIAGTAILISILSIIHNFVFHGKVKRYLSDKNTDNGIDGRGTIRDEIVSVVLGSSRVRSTLPKPQVIHETVQATNEISTETFNFIVETVLAEVTKKQPTEELAQQLEENYEKKYADAYDSNSGSFYSVDKYPTDSTVYELCIDPSTGDGTFTVCKTAYNRVTECRDYLEGASEVSGSGVAIHIVSEGKISYENGKYTVIKPLEIRFE